eukprot:m.91768 g.91768  ORF g.91768 m.91768 type:complete len:470 (-) comp8614_c0_seq2:291-1700(-)
MLECKPLHDGLILCSNNITYTPAGDCDGRHELISPSDDEFFEYVGICIALVSMAGIFSGLTLGLLSIDPMQLRVLSRGGKPSVRRHAQKIEPVLRNHHLLLVTLLLCNAVVNEALPLFLDRLVTEVYAIAISVSAVLLFGEVIPQALCSKHGLAIGAFFAPVVRVLMLLMSPIGYPLALLLDWLLGKEHTAYFHRAELEVLVEMHADQEAHANEEPLILDEMMIIKGALEMRDKTVESAMTPIKYVFSLSIDGCLDAKTMEEIIEHGHSRVPLYENGDYRQLRSSLLIKNLIQYAPEECTPLREVPRRRLMKMEGSMPLFDALNLFQTGKAHMSAVIDENHEIVGIITLEDVIEELIQEEIIDETDVYEDVQKRVRVARARRTSVGTRSNSLPNEIAIKSPTQTRPPMRVAESMGSGGLRRPADLAGSAASRMSHLPEIEEESSTERTPLVRQHASIQGTGRRHVGGFS